MKFIYRCRECGSEDVQTVEWIRPNTERRGRVALANGDPFSSSDNPDHNWCCDCDANVALYFEEVVDDSGDS